MIRAAALVLVGAVACLGALLAPMVLTQLHGSRAAAAGFLASVHARSDADAHARMTRRWQVEGTVAQLSRAVDAEPTLRDHRLALLLQGADTTGSRRLVEGFLVDGGGAHPIALELERDGAFWYVDLVMVEGRRIE